MSSSFKAAVGIERLQEIPPPQDWRTTSRAVLAADAGRDRLAVDEVEKGDSCKAAEFRQAMSTVAKGGRVA